MSLGSIRWLLGNGQNTNGAHRLTLTTLQRVMISVGNNGGGVGDVIPDARNDGVGVNDITANDRNGYIFVHYKLILEVESY